LSSFTSAEKGVIIQTAKGPKIILVNGNRQEINHKNGSFSAIKFEKYSVDFGLKETKTRSKNSVRVYSFKELITALSNPALDNIMQKKMFIEGNKRITTPLLALVYALIGCTGLLISNFNRRGQTKTVFLSLFCVVFIQAVDLTSGNLSIKNLGWLILMYCNILLPLFSCLLLLTKPELLEFYNLKKHNTAGEING
ncbi:MAG: LptF/LptG family permease, partial [Alphaproteobacteria bacterium]|nr:LptF/LptG family permease [Alphaproteobacteria bacterium]